MNPACTFFKSLGKGDPHNNYKVTCKWCNYASAFQVDQVIDLDQLQVFTGYGPTFNQVIVSFQGTSNAIDWLDDFDVIGIYLRFSKFSNISKQFYQYLRANKKTPFSFSKKNVKIISNPPYNFLSFQTEEEEAFIKSLLGECISPLIPSKNKENLDYLNHHRTFYICDMTYNPQYWMIVEKESFAVRYENGGLPSRNTLSSLQFFKITHYNTAPIYLNTAKSVMIYTMDVNIVIFFFKKKKAKIDEHCCYGVMIGTQFKNFFAELEISGNLFRALEFPIQSTSMLCLTLKLMYTSTIVEAVRTCGNTFESIGESELKRIWGPNFMNI
ncbi:hypothetical protein RFI_32860 [Reticulomyxa filosa]|uniref:Uncharacterized protein n=1 Tax=Reticulomyxa filosa TaxID=46433 RepID=X6LTU4_RETFI|nr:hypothetical protein RFI_32860 [Reticulomyxa filosa]|eukprot:ETO04537.1 hypothetical protein RFI_32860 [Reticulomyxa filosa]